MRNILFAGALTALVGLLYPDSPPIQQFILFHAAYATSILVDFREVLLTRERDS